MRIVSYNILDGGEGRADPLAEVIEAQRPDIVGLVEADDLGVVQRLAMRLGMDFVHAVGRQHASALLSRWPIRDSINHALVCTDLTRSLLQATVIAPGGEEWGVGVLHLSPHASEDAERQREAEVNVVLGIFAEWRRQGRRHLLMGDFNANSPLQEIDPQKCKPRTRQEWEQNGGQIPRRVVQRLLDAGYVEVMQIADPRLARTGGTFSTQFPGQRVDYVFAYGVEPTRIRQAWIEQDRLARFASDHYPVGVELANVTGVTT